MTYKNITFTIEGGVGRLTIERAAVLNAIDPKTVNEMRDVLARLKQDASVRALLLAGAGRAFCSGVDLGGQLTGGSDDLLRDYANPLIEDLYALHVPIVVAVNGAAAGVGCSIALAADFVVAARSAYFMLAFAKVGLVPDSGATWLIPRLIGKSRATAMMMLGDRVTAETALGWGMIHSVVEDDALHENAMSLATKLAVGPTLSYGLIRRGIRECLEAPLTEALEIEARHQDIASASEDFSEGLAAFGEKRKPVFKGR